MGNFPFDHYNNSCKFDICLIQSKYNHVTFDALLALQTLIEPSLEQHEHIQ